MSATVRSTPVVANGSTNSTPSRITTVQNQYLIDQFRRIDTNKKNKDFIDHIIKTTVTEICARLGLHAEAATKLTEDRSEAILKDLCTTRPSLNITLTDADKIAIIRAAFHTSHKPEPGKSLRDPKFFNETFIPLLLTMHPGEQTDVGAGRPIGEELAFIDNLDLSKYAEKLQEVYAEMFTEGKLPSIEDFASMAKGLIEHFPQDAEPTLIVTALLEYNPQARFSDDGHI